MRTINLGGCVNKEVSKSTYTWRMEIKKVTNAPRYHQTEMPLKVL